MIMKLTKKKAEEFAKFLCGTSKGLISDWTCNGSWMIETGVMRYNFWITEGRIYCQIAIGCEVKASYYFNFETLEQDFEYTDEVKEKYRRKEEKADKYEFLLYLRDSSKIKVNIPDELLAKYEERW